MGNTTKIYANAVASYNAGRLLDREQIKRLSEAEFSDAVKIACDYGYGGGVLDGANYDADTFISDETARLIDYVLADSPSDFLSRCLTNRFLYANAKALYKNKFTDVDLDAALYRMDGSEAIARAVESGDLSALPKPMAEAFELLARQFADSPADSRRIELALTHAQFADSVDCAKKSGSKIMRRYVTADIDLTNLLTLFRCKALGLDEASVQPMLIDGGSIGLQELTELYKAETAAAANALADTDYADAVRRLADGGSLTKFAVETDDYLYFVTNAEADNMLSLSPFLGYFTAKLAELKAVKMILTCLKNGARDEIQSRLGAMYTANGI